MRARGGGPTTAVHHRLGLVALALAGAACSPHFDKGAYLCGPERLCPPDLVCDEVGLTCESSVLARPFACPEGSDAREPDDVAEEAFAAGALRCALPLVEGLVGCIEGDDVDLVAFTYDVRCARDPRIDARLIFPVSLAPLRLVLRGEDGAEVAVGERCTPDADGAADEVVCLEARPPAGTYVLQVELAGDADCDGDCRYNAYRLDVSLPLS